MYGGSLWRGNERKSGAEEVSAVSFADVFVNRHGRWMLALAYTTDLPEVPEKYRVENRTEN